MAAWQDKGVKNEAWEHKSHKVRHGDHKVVWQQQPSEARQQGPTHPTHLTFLIASVQEVKQGLSKAQIKQTVGLVGNEHFDVDQDQATPIRKQRKIEQAARRANHAGNCQVTE
jgi:hypothetical protein